MMKKISILTLVLTLSACATGPDFVTPALPSKAPQAFLQPKLLEGSVHFSEQGLDQWWQSFDSKILNTWVNKALSQSPNAKIASATLANATAVYAQSRAVLYPQADVTIGLSRQATLNLPNVRSGDFSNSSSSTYGLHNVGVQVGYNFDVFGATKRGIEAKEAQLATAKWQWQAAMNTLAGNVVTAGINLAALRAQVQDSEVMLALQERQLATTRAQRKIGALSDVEVANAELAVAATRATLPNLRKQQRALENQLAILVGEFPSAEQILTIDLSALKAPQEIPLLVPAAMLRKRPDIQMAEAQWHSATALLGYAQAQYYPQFSIGGSLSSQALKLANLLNTTIWSVGTTISQVLFHGGELPAKEAQAEAGIALAKAQYEQTVLSAFANVSNALIALEQDQQALKAQKEALAAAERSYNLAKVRYQAGTISQYELLSVERTYQQNRISHIQVLGNRLANLAALYLVAGGNTDFSSYLPTQIN